MKVTLHPSKLKGIVPAVASKSFAHRAIIAASLADKETEIILNTTSQDIEATLQCIKALGADYIKNGTNVKIIPLKKAVENAVLDCGESGSTARFLLPVAAAVATKTFFTGHGRLPERPQKELADAIKSGGGNTDSDYLPMTVYGRLKCGTYEIAGDISSQYISGLMFALGCLEGTSEIKLKTPLESAPYVDITAQVLADFGIKIEKTGKGYIVQGGTYTSPSTYTVEGDWSNSAFWLIASRMGADIGVTGLNPDSLQGDMAVLTAAGKEVIDASQIPDLVPILAVYAASKKGRTEIINAGRLKIKESDRLHTVAESIKALGGDVQELPEGLVVNGTGRLRGGKVSGYGDHRIVMSMSIASLICDEAVEIEGAEAASKSYPNFFEDFKMLGGNIHVE